MSGTRSEKNHVSTHVSLHRHIRILHNYICTSAHTVAIPARVDEWGARNTIPGAKLPRPCGSR